jgi:uncharacterized protein (TIGR02246 family)
MSTRFAVGTLIAAALTACQQAETPEQTHARMQMESDSARAAIEAKGPAWAMAFNNRQVDAIAALYVEDAVAMPPDMPAVSGRDNIRATFEAMMSQSPQGTTVAFEIQGVSANGPLAVERGAWVMTIPTPDGASSQLRGKYLIEWHRVNGEWLIATDTWNNDAPAAPQPAQ